MGKEILGKILKIKGIIVFIILLWTTVVIAGTPSLQLLTTVTTETLATGSKDTITVTGVDLAGDSIGVMMNFNRDSLSGIIKYKMVTPQGNSNVTFTEASTLSTFTCVEGQQAAFAGPVPASAGNYECYLYFIITNDDATTQTITANIYKVIWR